MVVNRQNRLRVAVRPLAGFLRRVQRALRVPGREVTVCLLSDRAMARLNWAFRHKRGPTDVLSFRADGLSPAARNREAKKQGNRSQVVTPGRERYLGDIAISPETARRNARRRAHRLEQELRALILHGVLHLVGYDHETDRGEMTRLENRLRRKLKLS